MPINVYEFQAQSDNLQPGSVFTATLTSHDLGLTYSGTAKVVELDQKRPNRFVVCFTDIQAVPDNHPPITLQRPLYVAKDISTSRAFAAFNPAGLTAHTP